MICSNGKTEIEFWYNEEDSTIWSFKTTDADILIFDQKLIGITKEELFTKLGYTDEMEKESIYYNHMDFALSIEIVNDIVKSIHVVKYL